MERFKALLVGNNVPIESGYVFINNIGHIIIGEIGEIDDNDDTPIDGVLFYNSNSGGDCRDIELRLRLFNGEEYVDYLYEDWNEESQSWKINQELSERYHIIM
jgi:hypothetical protein